MGNGRVQVAVHAISDWLRHDFVSSAGHFAAPLRSGHSSSLRRAAQLGILCVAVLGHLQYLSLEQKKMKDLVGIAEQIAARLMAHKQTIAVAESSTGGLISAALLSVPGASNYFLGSAVVYTRDARRILMGIGDDEMKGIRSASEPYAKLLANRARERFATHWALSETGATGPTGNRYGDSAGHCCLAVAGAETRVMTLETGSNDRVANMQVFATAALKLLLQQLQP
jgi:PncC family amidohydrolase